MTLKEEIAEILAEYKIGFVVGDKDIDKHLAEFNEAIISAVRKRLPEKVEFSLGWNEAIEIMEKQL